MHTVSPLCVYTHVTLLLVNDPNYVSEVKSSGAPPSRIPVKKGSVSAKFNKLHQKEFDKYVHQN